MLLQCECAASFRYNLLLGPRAYSCLAQLTVMTLNLHTVASHGPGRAKLLNVFKILRGTLKLKVWSKKSIDKVAL